jgi:hypothetical protein
VDFTFHQRRKLMNFEQTLRQLARHINNIWPQIDARERAAYKKWAAERRASNQKIRELWYQETEAAATERAKRRAA